MLVKDYGQCLQWSHGALSRLASMHMKCHKVYISVYFMLGMIDKVRVLCLGGSIFTHSGAAQPQTSSLRCLHVSNLERVGFLIRPLP